MVMMNYSELRKMYDGLGRVECIRRLREALQTKQLRGSDFSLAEIAEAVVVDREGNPCGREWLRSLDPRRAGDFSAETIYETVDSSAFSAISGQIVYTTLLEAYENPAFVGDQLMNTIPTNLDGEKIAGITGLGDQSEVVAEGKEYPRATPGADWIETPRTDKKGIIIEVTKEATFFDRTGQLLERSSQVGESMGLAREKRRIDIALGITNNHKWRGTAYDTYQASAPWVNVLASNGIENWSDIDAALQTMAALTDPATQEPIVMIPNTVLCHSSKRATFEYVLNATQIKVDPNANSGTAQYQMYVPNSALVKTYNVISSPFVDARYTAASKTTTDWHFGDFKKALAYMENWPLQVVTMPPNSYDEWNRDVVAGWKASERGKEIVRQPRAVMKCTA